MARDLAGNGTLGSFTEEQLFSGEADIVTDSAEVPAELNLPKYTVLMKNAGGQIVAWDGAAPNAVGILAQPLDTTAATGTGVATDAPFFKGGVFNPLALVWPAGADTLAERVAAFERTNVVIRRLL
jgi:hypothetical protein